MAGLFQLSPDAPRCNRRIALQRDFEKARGKMELKEVYLGAEKACAQRWALGMLGGRPLSPGHQSPCISLWLQDAASYWSRPCRVAGGSAGWGPAIWVVPGSWPGPALAFAGIPRLNQQSTLSTLSLK